MTEPYVDTDILIRLVTGDDPAKQARAVALFSDVEKGRLILKAPDTVIADAVYVLTSPRLYALARTDVRDILVKLVQLPGFHVRGRPVVLQALDLYATTNLDFGDAMIIASMQRDGETNLYSYDHDFGKVRGLVRLEP